MLAKSYTRNHLLTPSSALGAGLKGALYLILCCYAPAKEKQEHKEKQLQLHTGERKKFFQVADWECRLAKANHP